ncbi:hypothetical protein [Sulfurospirillum arcachonense]|uniref:hypothetical protein n=1 Tax=Sulfurospirillum arcachonense TaxID=57666 RepID=UPI000468397C|nr:hypothetical protein [Sulfurospirillum arcachonense]
MKWLSSLKLAIIDNNINVIEKLINEVPIITKIDEAKEAKALIEEAISIVQIEKQKTLETMNKIKRTKAFLNSH